MSDPTDPLINDLVKAGGGSLISGGGVFLLAWRALTRSEADREAERKIVFDKLEAMNKVMTDMSAKFDKELALLAQNAEVKNDRQEWLEKRLEDFDERLRKVESYRSRDSGIQSTR